MYSNTEGYEHFGWSCCLYLHFTIQG